MYKYIDKMLTELPIDMNGTARNDAMAQVLWTRKFLTAQGMYILTTTIYKDNKSTILLAENGKSSRSMHS